VSFIRTGLREMGLKIRRQRTRMALRHQKRLLQKSEIHLGREGCSEAVNFPEVRSEIVALKKLEHEQKEVATRIAQLEEGIKQIEAQRQENAKEQNAAIAKLEVEKKPILVRRNEAKAALDVCDRELTSVDKRLRENETADRDLLKQLSDLQAQTPPPANLDAQTTGIASRRARLPAEHEEISRARLGSAEACRAAKESLAIVQGELDVVEKNIARVRGEFEARDRALGENSRAQQESIRDAKAHHQTVEERKNPAYLNIGRHLATKGIAPPNAPHLLKDVQRHREGVDRHLAHTAELARLSSEIDKQELRKFYFSIVSVLVLLAIILPLVFQTPSRSEWLPRETEAIVSLKIEQFERDETPKRWRKDRAAAWPNLWSALLGDAAKTPVLNLSNDVSRVTRAMATTSAGAIQEYVLLEARNDLSRPVRALEHDQTYDRRSISGLPLWQKDGLAVARVGPRTIAVGGPSEVEELVDVRLGLKQDLKITGLLFDRYQSLDQESALRLISRDPPNLLRIFQPLFPPDLLNASQLLGFSLALKNPAKARLLLRAKTTAEASDLAQRMRDDPRRWLKLQDSELLLYEQTPEINQQGQDLEVKFNVPENSAFLLLERLGRPRAAAPLTATR
jgi:hypothetical protein